MVGNFKRSSLETPDSHNYNVFLLRENTTANAKFLFSFRQDPKQRPTVGDVIINPITFESFKILKDVLPTEGFDRITEEGDVRITEEGDIRIIEVSDVIFHEIVDDPDKISHDFFVTPANNKNRISSFTTAGFSNDQTLKQLFR